MRQGGGGKKALSQLIGMDLGPSRLPVVDPTEEHLRKMKKEVDELKIVERL